MATQAVKPVADLFDFGDIPQELYCPLEGNVEILGNLLDCPNP